MAAVGETQPPLSTTSTPQASFEAGPSMSPRSRAKIQVKEELSLIVVSVLPLSYKDLAFASVHLAPKTSVRIYRGVRKGGSLSACLKTTFV